MTSSSASSSSAKKNQPRKVAKGSASASASRSGRKVSCSSSPSSALSAKILKRSNAPKANHTSSGDELIPRASRKLSAAEQLLVSDEDETRIKSLLEVMNKTVPDDLIETLEAAQEYLEDIRASSTKIVTHRSNELLVNSELVMKKTQIAEFMSHILNLATHHDVQNVDWIQAYLSTDRFEMAMNDEIFEAIQDASGYAHGIEGASEEEILCRYLIRILRRATTTHMTLGADGEMEMEFLLREDIENLYAALDKHVDTNDIVRLEFLRRFQNDFINKHIEVPRRFFCRGIAMIQSSGCGKSRLVRNIALSIPSFTIVLEPKPGQGSSVPRPDTEVCEFFVKRSTSNLGHVIAAAFLAALFDQLYVYLVMCSAARQDRSVSLKLCSKEDVEAKRLSIAITQKSKAKEEMANRRLDFKPDILDPLYDLRPSTGGNAKNVKVNRRDFLDSVILLATELLAQRDCLKTWSGTVNEEEKRLPGYIGRVGLSERVRDLFELIDGAQGAIKYERNKPPIARLLDVPDAKYMPRQFILGLDECSSLDTLLEKSNKVGQPRRELAEKKQLGGRPQGLASFMRLFHDMEEVALAEKGSGSEENIRDNNGNKTAGDNELYKDEPLQRVWIAMLDTTSSARVLAPRSTEDKILQTSERCLDADCEEVNSIWHSFGMDHNLRRFAQEYYDKYPQEQAVADLRQPVFNVMTLQQLLGFGHLKIMGRGLWSAHKVNQTLLKLAMVKVAFGLTEWQSYPIFHKVYQRGTSIHLDQRSFAIASLRFCLDNGALCQDGGDSLQYIEDAIAKHMRILEDFPGENMLETSTPSEPILASAALLLLNYGHSMLKNVTLDMAHKKLHIEWKAVRNDRPWMNLLLDMAFCFERSADLVNIGDAGELLGRMILTRARDKALPKKWDLLARPIVPCFTLRHYLRCLLEEDKEEGKGKDGNYAERILEQASSDNLRDLGDAFLNFMQFTPYTAPISDTQRSIQVNEGPLSGPKAMQGFLRACAFICIANQAGVDFAIPMLRRRDSEDGDMQSSGEMPSYDNGSYMADAKKEADGLEDAKIQLGADEVFRTSDPGEGNDYFPCVTLSELQAEFMLVQIKNQGEEQTKNRPPNFPDIAVKYPDGTYGFRTPRIVVMMELGSLGVKFQTNSRGYISPYILANTMTSKFKKGRGKNSEIKTAPFLYVEIRGMNQVYPCFRQIDPNDQFQTVARSVMATRLNKLESNKISKTLPWHFEDREDFENEHPENLDTGKSMSQNSSQKSSQQDDDITMTNQPTEADEAGNHNGEEDDEEDKGSEEGDDEDHEGWNRKTPVM